jgi:hypothetical protein
VDVWTYFEQTEKEFQELSLEPDRPPDDMFSERAGSTGRRGRIFGLLTLVGSPVEAFIACSEVVRVRGNRMTRDEYGYFLIIDGEEVFGYERDLSHDPAVHMHTADHIRQEANPIAFKKFAELAWAEVSKREPRK